MSATEVRLVGRSSPFLADEVEYRPSGWLHAAGRWPRWDIDDATDQPVVRYGPRREYAWPAHRVREVRRRG